LKIRDRLKDVIISGGENISSVEVEAVLYTDVIAFCRESLAGFKCPKTVIFKELPKTSTGKIQKFILREEARVL